MERFRQDLEERLGPWVGPLPQCADHPDTAAVAVCPHCRRPICSACVHPLPTSLRCHACRPWLERVVPAGWIAPLTLVTGILGRKWALQSLAFCIGWAMLLWLCPNLVRPVPPDLPDWLDGSRLKAPFLEQSFRISSTGHAFAEQGDIERAKRYYERAEQACRRHIEEAGNSPLNPQVWLGVGLLQEKQGKMQEAAATYHQLLKGKTRVRGVAAYHLGMIEETHHNDRKSALAYYQQALDEARQPADALGELVSFFAEDRERNQWPYIVASLTGTVTSTAAIKDDIEEAVARCQPCDAEPSGEAEAVEFLGAE